jgi:antitoxin (DNA-binding transcriptional repressor) of toxin-antitoxin stability system
MAETVYISEAEAARNFAGLVDRALEGQQIVVRRGGQDVVLVSPLAAGSEMPPKTVGEVIAGLRGLEADRGLSRADDEFGPDMERVHGDLNSPMDDSKWG